MSAGVVEWTVLEELRVRQGVMAEQDSETPEDTACHAAEHE